MESVLNSLGISLDRRSAKIVSYTLMSIAVAVGVFFGYRWWKTGYEERAQNRFGTLLELYERASKKPEEVPFSEVSGAFTAGYDEFSSSVLSPFFLAGKADALVMEGKHAEALAVLDAMLLKLKKSSPFYGQYAVKRALIARDSSDESVRAQGNAELVALSEDKSLGVRDMALFYRGLEAYTLGNIAEAQMIFLQLIREFGDQSVWAYEAQRIWSARG